MGAKSAYAVIFAGGVGSRMQGAKIPKQFLELGGKSIIAHTIDHFEHHPEIMGMIVVCVASGIEHMERIVADGHYEKVLSIVPGGETGQDSIFNGLAELHRIKPDEQDAVVLIHDGVRPLIDEETITACIDSVERNGSTATVASSPETVIEEDKGVVCRVVDRSRCKLARAPQGFLFGDLYEEHLRAREEGRHDFIDSISLMAHYGHKVYTVEGPADNIKVTTQRDFFAFKGFMDYKEMEQLWPR